MGEESAVLDLATYSSNDETAAFSAESNSFHAGEKSFNHGHDSFNVEVTVFDDEDHCLSDEGRVLNAVTAVTTAAPRGYALNNPVNGLK